MASYELFLRGTLDKIGVLPDYHPRSATTRRPSNHLHRTCVHAGAPRDGPVPQRAICTSSWCAGLAEGAPPDGGGDTRPHRSRAVPARGRGARGPGRRRWPTRIEIDDKVELGRGRPACCGRQRVPRRSVSTPVGLNRGPRIAVIYAVGMITSGRAAYDPPSTAQVLGSTPWSRTLRTARADELDSRHRDAGSTVPGGSAIASDVIWRELMLTRDREARGRSCVDVGCWRPPAGYYIAMPASTIVAQPGDAHRVDRRRAAGKFVIDGTFDKLGRRTSETVTSGRVRRPVLAVAAVHARASARRSRADGRRPTTPSSRRRRRGARRRPSASTRSRRGASGPARRRRSADSSTSSAGSTERSRSRKTARKIAPGLGSGAGGFSGEEIAVRGGGASRGAGRTAARALDALLGARNARAVDAVSAPLRLFRRGEPLTLMPNVFVR